MDPARRRIFFSCVVKQRFKKVCEQLNHALESTTKEMEKLNADYAKSSELIYEISVPYTDDDLSEHYADKRFNKLNGILKSVGFEGSDIF